MVTIKTVCCNNHIFEWKSQPDLNNLPAGNVLIPSAIVFTGGTYEPIKQFSQALNMNFVNKHQFYDVQGKVIFPIINKAYTTQQDAVIGEIKNKIVQLIFAGMVDQIAHATMPNTEPTLLWMRVLKKLLIFPWCMSEKCHLPMLWKMKVAKDP